MNQLTWVDYAQGVGAVLTPLLAAWLIYTLNRRQSRSHELLTARLTYYRQIVPDLNSLMCYFTFIGDWKLLAPTDVISTKRRLDKAMFCAAPLFSPAVLTAYDAFMRKSFDTFNDWGQDALLLTSAYRRRPVLPTWDTDWDRMFKYSDERAIPAEELTQLRAAYDGILAALVRDIDITRARTDYTKAKVSLNAHAPRRDAVSGQPAA